MGGVHVAGEDRTDDGKVYCRVVHFQSAGNVEKDIFLCQFEAYTFSNTASSIFMRRMSNPVAERCGLPYTALLTNACVSMRNGLMPSIAGGDGYAAHTFMVLGSAAVRMGCSPGVIHLAAFRKSPVRQCFRSGS